MEIMDNEFPIQRNENTVVDVLCRLHNWNIYLRNDDEITLSMTVLKTDEGLCNIGSLV